jgi:PilZ domain-containing protein
MPRDFSLPPAVASLPSEHPTYTDVRRRHARAPLRAPAELTLASGAKHAGKIEQLSEGGVLFVASTPMTPGESAELRFPVAGRIVLVRVTCCWSTPLRASLHQCGFAFESSPVPPVETLRTVVARAHK